MKYPKRAMEGYVIVAANSEHYLELAVNAACSLKTLDNRPVALLISGGLLVPRDYLGIFDYIVSFDPLGVYGGNFTRRFVLDRYTPFSRSIHVDADCFLVSRKIDRMWERFRGLPVGTMAHVIDSGIHFNGGVDVGALVEAGVCTKFPMTNWGVFYFEADEAAANPVMQEARALLEAHIAGNTPAAYTYFSQPGQYSDEPIWGLALARVGIEPLRPDYSELLQATSPNSSDHKIDYEEATISMRKGGLNDVSGHFFHFCGISPFQIYLEGVLHFRGKMGISPPVLTTREGRVLFPEDMVGKVGGMPDRGWRFSRRS